MKALYNYILEASLLEDAKSSHTLIQKYLEDNYNGYDGSWTISEKPNKDGLYEVSSNYDIICKENITSLTNGMFIWTKVKGYFSCAHCNSLKTLEGAPKEVENSFFCYDCKSLTSLKGAPKKVEVGFNCSECNSLKTLEGAPEIVEGPFDCTHCKSLTSLKGAPKIVEGSFNCSNCKSLTSLKGAPKEVEGSFICYDCGKPFTEDDVKKESKIKGYIYC
jgi:hypothetical protein